MYLKPSKIEIFLKDGSPRGIRYAEIGNWNGEAIACPRRRLKELFKERDDIKGKPAVYFLVGDMGEAGLKEVYIGEADGIQARLNNHLHKEDWWQEVIIFISQGNKLTKADVKYLESICIEKAKKAGKCELRNTSEPSRPTLSIADISVKEDYYEKLSLLIPLLGHDILAVPAHYEEQLIKSEKGENILVFCKGKGASAKGVYTKEGRLQVFKDSTSVKDIAPAFHHHNYKNLRDSLIKKGKLIEKGDFCIFVDDYVFDSPSAAAAVVLGRSAAGPREWKTVENKTLKELE